jgi:hypothetical protein
MLKPSTTRIGACALAVGLLFAVVTGVSVSGSDAVFSPAFALVGFAVGTLIGAATGFLWGHFGTSGSLGFILVTVLGSFAGLMAASLLGAQNHAVVTDTYTSMEYGALIGGAVLGVIGGAACAWRFRPSTPLKTLEFSRPTDND